MAMTFVKPRLMRWNNNAITDHNRSPMSVSVERIEKSHRLVNGTLRKYVVADKRSFSCSWEMLPKLTDQTVDGFWGGEAMENFYDATKGAFALALTDGDGENYTYTVMFEDFSKEIIKRGNVDYWTVSVDLVEV